MKTKNYDFIIGVDPGLGGGITILDNNKDELEVHSMPISILIKGTKKDPKKVKEIDCQGIVDILSKVKDKNVLFMIERVTSRGGEAPNRAFNFGYGWGYIQGVAWTLGFEVSIVSPQRWKKAFPELETKDISILRDEINFLKDEIKNLQSNKMPKDKIKEKKKEISQKDSKLKRLAKSAAREFMTQKYPKHKDEFKLAKDDGRAEACLIALYGKNEIIKDKNDNKQKEKK